MGEAALIRTYIYRNKNNADGDVAIAFKGGSPLRAGRVSKFVRGSGSLQSPINSLLQHMDVTQSDGATICSTCPPSEMCLGLARLYGAHEIVYRHPGNGRLTTVPTRRDGSGSVQTGRKMDIPIGTEFPRDFPNTLASSSGLKTPQTFTVPEDVEFLPMKVLVSDQDVLDRFFTHVVLEIARKAFGHSGMVGANPRDRAHFGKNIASALVDKDGTLVSWGVNTNQSEKWRHAEVNTIYNLLVVAGEAFPEGATLYTTLEPCEMCAGLIAHVADGKRLRVVRAMDDPGIKESALQADGRCDVTSKPTPAQYRLDALTNRAVQPESVSAKLAGEFNSWRGDGGRDLPMTRFFDEAAFRDLTGRARAHWFEALWLHLQGEFYKKHQAKCDANVGRQYRDVTIKGKGWEKDRIETQSRVHEPASKKLTTFSRDDAFIRDMAQMGNNLAGVLKVYSQFLDGIPGQLGGG